MYHNRRRGYRQKSKSRRISRFKRKSKRIRKYGLSRGGIRL